jgi:dihydroflavonol-4-reductase
MEKQSSILVTGGTGLLGAYLLQYLVSQGFTNLKATKRASSNMELVASFSEKVTWLEGNVLDVFFLEDAFESVEYVFHCAAMVSFDGKDAAKMLHTNVEGTANVVNACLAENVKKLVHVSSIASLGRTKKTAENQLIDEKSKFQDTTYYSQYALSKYLSEQEVWRGSAEGLTMAIVNPSVILGSGYWNQSSTALFKTVWYGLKYYPIGSTGFVDVRDVARFMALLMDSEIQDERFILNGKNLSYKDYFSLVADAIGKNRPTVEVKPWLNALVWRFEWLRAKLFGRKPMVTKETAHTSAQKTAFDNQKSTEVFDFQYINIEKSIQEIGADFKIASQNGWKAVLLANEKK